ncbi:DHA2 family efflux MFS transporter permease subunit [Burkholderia seminalis]|nr:DHA2 family efflux MFS transporter permease subunit [Burkholderia seminalis]
MSHSSKEMNIPHRGMITLSIMLATLIQSLDSTIANVALPHMQGSLSASSDQITWVLTSYIVAAAIATPVTGWLCDRFGKKNVLLASILGFTVASALCGLSISLSMIVAARLLQGVFGAALVPLSQAILLDINPPEKQGSAMAVWGMGVMVGPILGPTLGGWLTDSYNWRWVFFINVPIGAFALFGVLVYIRSGFERRDTGFDFFGFATLSIAIGALQAMLDRGEQLDWFNSTEIWCEALASGISFVFFIAHTATVQGQSFFNRHLLRDRNYVTGLVFIFVVGVILFATRALLPPMLQSLMGYPVATAGLVVAPSGLGTMLAMLVVGRLIGRVDLRILIFMGFALTALSLSQMAGYTIVLSEHDIVWPGVVQGIGLGLVFVPLSTLTFATLTPEMRADGTAIFSLIRNIGSSIGISLVQTMLSQHTQIVHSSLVEYITRFNPMLLDATGAIPTVAQLAILDQQINAQAAMIGYIDDFKFMMWMSLLVIPLLLFVRPPRRGEASQQAHAVMD